MEVKQRQFLWLLVWSIAFPLVGALLINNDSRAAGSGNPAIRDTTQIDSAWRLAQPVTYENLTVFPVVSTEEADTSGFATLDDALASGAAIVTEQGSYMRRSRDGVIQPQLTGAQVNQLVLVNRGKKPLLLLAGEVVSGGKQDRIIGKDRIVPIGAEPLPLDVFCVEHGRWTSDGDKFGAAQLMVHPSVREKAAFDQDQSQVWAAVRSGSTASMSESIEVTGSGGGVGRAAAAPQISAGSVSATIASSAPTESYRKIYKSSPVGASVETYAEEIDRRFRRATTDLKGERVVGVVVAYGNEVAWSDVFASSNLFENYWPKLLRSYVVEALARPARIEKASLDDARDFLRPARGHIHEESEPGVYRWREQSEGREAAIELEALEPKPMTLHWLKVLRTN
ncbi:MAG TPA: DUF6569 family protein [Candidatus Acidoferrales bacterium]|nr:DUF6569 family protein [Candidatus Acidoferrales bacterium]